ncbi:hypothetical protein CEXT_757701 [Caerostris extrusa]|uniref:Uncharacterized protein n=1 Tax=Caerostris extrusa TaxID=172846 RepID=A0AAV4YEU1_CAEEX|nr:hypothetical protein CEXT_757701 [Caerostris extrusa]
MGKKVWVEEKSINKPTSSSTSCVICMQKQEIPRPISRDQWALPVRQSRKVKGSPWSAKGECGVAKTLGFLGNSDSNNPSLMRSDPPFGTGTSKEKKEFVEVTHGRKEKELFCGEEQKGR